MKDRNVEFPNRYRMVKVEGTDDIFDLVPAPGEVSDEGTFINKATLLKDATAALFGLGADAVPDDVFRSIFGVSNWYVWEKSKTVMDCGYTSTKKYTSVSADCAISNQNSYTAIRYGSTFEEVAFGGGTTVSVGGSKTQFEVLLGKYFVTGQGHPNGNVSTTDVYYADPNATISQYQQYSYTIIPLTQYVGSWSSIETTQHGYVSSIDPNAYPINDGFDYAGPWLLGGGSTTAGSYIGTGTYGQSNKNRVTLNFVPKLFILWGTGYAFYPYQSSGMPVVLRNRRNEISVNLSSSGDSNLKFSFDGTTVSWYSASSASWQCNTSGTEYFYTAIG